MAYNLPVSSRILLRSRVAQSPVNNTLGTVTFDQVDIGSQYLSSGSPPSVFTAPYAGHYDVFMESWNCGLGSGEIIVTSLRGASTTYAQQQFVANGCFNAGNHFIIPNVQKGDTIGVQANMNTTGVIVTSITNATDMYAQGVCTIFFYPSN